MNIAAASIDGLYGYLASTVKLTVPTALLLRLNLRK
jgi:hypothetical protein